MEIDVEIRTQGYRKGRETVEINNKILNQINYNKSERMLGVIIRPLLA